MIIDRRKNNHLKSGTKGLKTSDVTTKPEYSQNPHYPENLGAIIIHNFIFIFYNYIYLHFIVTKTWAIRRISSSYSPLLFMLLRLGSKEFVIFALRILLPEGDVVGDDAQQVDHVHALLDEVPLEGGGYESV